MKKKKGLELEDYNDDELAEIKEELTDDYDDFKTKKPKNFTKIINVVFVILIVIMLMITVDIVCVARYNKGPFFAIKTTTYKDGGTKVYYGFGYKVIKYNQVQGRRDMQIGLWTMPYNIEPLNLQDLDLAIEFTDSPNKTYKKYYKKFVRISSTLSKIDNTNKTITLGYKDEDGKYTHTSTIKSME